MTEQESKLDASLIKMLFRFEEATGRYFFNERPLHVFKSEKCQRYWNKRYVGKEAFTALDGEGYRLVIIHGKTHKAHRVVWAFHKGVWPTYNIDHINGIPNDNRIENLRDVSMQDNARNRRRVSRNTSGVTGVVWARAEKKWHAQIKVSGKCISLGNYSDKLDAIAARKQAEAQYGFHPNHGREHGIRKATS